ncbi:hypothetical protein QBC33DRAFT_537139 [Phialemonium atrogriseum]|uniref:Uncharacterized protein n=1 Tax=Phialemonium atrogriseum TaxID=1093897 RepID=A0AAJ0FP17_9PEZI|nr:uncharacterized protein QBC33DRAFT_537139 [Phialemonium atrogriseum]KAK1767730.1 hypothetical protein QBC33DRAFT_537139 [Phialemonium atrogriseum]
MTPWIAALLSRLLRSRPPQAASSLPIERCRQQGDKEVKSGTDRRPLDIESHPRWDVCDRRQYRECPLPVDAGPLVVASLLV